MRKSILCQMLFGRVLSLALITVSIVSIPFAALAQTDSPSEKNKKEKTESAEEEIVLTIEGLLDKGKFGFSFMENEIIFGGNFWPAQLKVNGKPWDNPTLPFELDYTPDFAKMAILEKDFGSEVFLKNVSPRQNFFSVKGVSSGTHVPFRVKLAMKNQIPRDTLSADGTKEGGNKPETDKTSQSVAANPDSKEKTVTIEGSMCEGYFIFRDHSIHFTSMGLISMTEGITVNGKPWEDLTKPFELDYTPDFDKAGILEREGNSAIKCAFYNDKEFAIRVSQWGRKSEPFRVKLAMKDPLPHEDIAFYRYISKPQIDGSSGEYKSIVPIPDPADVKWAECNRERKIILECSIYGQGAFVFEGNTIRYRHGLYDRPNFVSVNGRGWGILKEPFVLDFQIDTEHPEMVQVNGRKPVKLKQINSQCFELVFNDPQFDQYGSARYSVTITSKKETVDQTPEPDHKALAESAGSLRGGIASRLPAK